MEYSEKNKNEIMVLLGTGLSVMSLCKAAHISFEELCEIAGKFGSLKAELKKWYPKYDFEVRVKATPKAEPEPEKVEEEKPEVKKRAVSKRK